MFCASERGVLAHTTSRMGRHTAGGPSRTDPRAGTAARGPVSRPGSGTAQNNRMNHAVLAELVSNVLKVVVAPGQSVAVGDTIVILESMKMEIPVLAEYGGTIAEVAVSEGDVITEGDTIAVITM